jgi:spore coat polysaccharide biosynthesis protein SpsF
MIVAIVQARMGSTRLPGKVLKEVSGYPLLWHIVDRLHKAKELDEIVVATSISPSDDRISDFCEGLDISYYRGSEDDVLDRYYGAAKHFVADTIVRITADCPLIDPRVLDNVVEVYSKEGCDYASNTIDRTYPDGLDVEVFSFQALEKASLHARLPSEREHVTPYIWKNPHLFRICQVTQERDLSSLRWTVDQPQDLEFVRVVYRHLYQSNKIFITKDILRLLDEHPEYQDINQGFKRNDGYLRSLQKDHIVPG